MTQHNHPESGNMIFFIMLAIVLIGLVTAALRSDGSGTGIDRENNIIEVSQIRQYMTELERGITYAMQNEISEVDISFAHPDAPSDYGTYNTNPKAEIFNPAGGGANWRTPPSGITSAPNWEFYATSSVPGVGSDRADLIAVLPDISQAACDEINRINEQTDAPDDSSACFYTGASSRFDGTYSDSSPNEMDDDISNGANFTTIPATQACVTCATARHFYHVLLAR